MGVGHVPTGPVPREGEGAHLPGRQHRGDPAGIHPVDPRRAVGRVGEEIAARFLVERGARLIGRNLTVDGGEVDLLAEIAGIRTVVEVRTVTGDRPAVEAFGGEKADRVWRLARRLRPPATRVDVVAVRLRPTGADVHWVRNVP